MSWCKVNLTCNKNDIDIIEEILLSLNAISISLVGEKGNSEIYEPKPGETPLWDTIELSALFENKVSREVINSFLEGVTYSNLYINKIEDQNWIAKYQENFKPIKFGQKLWVVPSWSKRMDLFNIEGIELKMDPGMAFGSGSHETTHLCLEYLEKNSPKELTVLDYGCGSGILAIASLLLGADYAVATDIDPQALESTKVNSINNKVIDRIEIVKPGLIPNIKIDLLIANILSNIIIDHRDTFSGILESDSRLVLSGIMKEQLNKIINFYEEFYTPQRIEYKNDWCLVELFKK